MPISDQDARSFRFVIRSEVRIAEVRQLDSCPLPERQTPTPNRAGIEMLIKDVRRLDSRPLLRLSDPAGDEAEISACNSILLRNPEWMEGRHAEAILFRLRLFELQRLFLPLRLPARFPIGPAPTGGARPRWRAFAGWRPRVRR